MHGVEPARAADPDREVALALAESRGVLAPGGTLYVTVPTERLRTTGGSASMGATTSSGSWRRPRHRSRA